MPSTYTLNNGIELIATGEQSGTWGDTTNTNMSLLDTALDGQVTVTLASAGTSGSPNTLPISDGAASDGRNRMVIFNDGADLGATAYVQLTPNDAEKIVYIRNALSGSRSIIVFQGTYNASNDYEIPAGTTAVVYFNGGGTGAVAANVFNNAHFDALNIVGSAAVGTTLTVGTSLNIASSTTVDGVLDEDNMASDSATKLATQQSIKAYVDSQVTAQDLDFAGDSGTGAVDLDSQTFTISGTTNEIETSASGQTLTVGLPDNVTIAGDLTVDTNTLFVDSSTNKVSIGTTSSDGTLHVHTGSAGVVTAAAAADDLVIENSNAAGLSLLFDDTSTNSYGVIYWGNETDGNADGRIEYFGSTYVTAGDRQAMLFRSAGVERLRLQGTAVVLNETGADTDFRVESDTNTHALFVDAGNSRVGINVSAPSAPLHVDVSGTADAFILTRDTGTNGQLEIDFTTAFTNFNSATGGYVFSITGTEIASFETTGTFTTQRDSVFNEGGGDYDFRVESNSNAHALFVDAGNSRVGINESAPDAPLHITASTSATIVEALRIENTASGGGEGNSIVFNPVYDGLATISAQRSGADADGTEMFFSTNKTTAGGATTVEHLRFYTGTSTVFNETGADQDFRVESNNNENMLFVDAGNNSVNIAGASDPSAGNLIVTGSANAASASHRPAILGRGSYGGGIASLDTLESGWYQITSGTTWNFYHGRDTSSDTPDSKIVQTFKSDETVFNESSRDLDFRVESDLFSHALFVDAGLNRIGFFDGSPDRPVHLKSTGSRNYIKAETTVNNIANEAGFDIKTPVTNTIIGALGAGTPYIYFYDLTNGYGNLLKLHAAADGAVFNDDSHDLDFRVESDNSAHMLFVDAGNNRVGIGLSTPGSLLQLSDPVFGGGSAKNTIGFGSAGWGNPAAADQALDGGVKLALFEGATQKIQIGMNSSAALWFNATGSGTTGFKFYSANTDAATPVERLHIGQTGDLVFNTTGVDADFRISSVNNGHMLFVDASTDSIGINTGSPGAKLDINGGDARVINTGGGVVAKSRVSTANQTDAITSARTTDSNGTRTGFMANAYPDASYSATVSRDDTDFSAVGWQYYTLNSTYENQTHAILKFENVAGTEYELITATFGQIVVNEASRSDIDFRVESDSNTHALFVDAGEDTVSIGTSSPPSDTGVASPTLNVSGSAQISSGYYTTFGNPNGRVFTLNTAGNGASAFIKLEGADHVGYRSEYMRCTNASGIWTITVFNSVTSGTAPTFTIANNSTANPTITLGFNTAYSGGYCMVNFGSPAYFTIS
jgi:hypothetical protein